MKKIIIVLGCQLLITAAVLVMLLVFTTPSSAPDETQARADFLALHPGALVSSVVMSEREVAAVSYSVAYQEPPDLAQRTAQIHYLYDQKQWRLLP